MNAFTRGKKNLFIPDLLQNDMSKAQNLQELPSVAVFFLTVVHTNFCVNVLIALCWCNTKCIQLNPHLSNFTNCQFTHTRSQPNLYFQAHFHMWYTNIWCRKMHFTPGWPLDSCQVGKGSKEPNTIHQVKTCHCLCCDGTIMIHIVMLHCF